MSSAPHPRRLAALALALALVHAGPPAHAEVEADGGLPILLAVEGGVSIFGNSRSTIPVHLLDPTFKLEALVGVHERLALGVELSATVGDSAGYRLLGGVLMARVTPYQGDLFGLHVSIGGGLGTGPAILASDLLVASDATVWLVAGLDFRWRVLDWLEVGVGVANEHLTVVSATAGLAFVL